MRRLLLVAVALGAGRLLYSAIGRAVRAADEASAAAEHAKSVIRLATVAVRVCNEQTRGLTEIRDRVEADLAILSDHHERFHADVVADRMAREFGAVDMAESGGRS